MKAFLHGFKHNTGEFNGKPYDHYKLHISHESNDDKLVGMEVTTLKVTPKVFQNYCATTDGTVEGVLGYIEINLGLNNNILSIVKCKE